MSVTNEQILEAEKAFLAIPVEGKLADVAIVAAKVFLDLLNRADEALLTEDRIKARDSLNRLLNRSSEAEQHAMSQLDWNKAV
jgi:hypothetical protein